MTETAAKAAKAIGPLLPLTGRLKLTPTSTTPTDGDLTSAVTATFVGSTSAEVLLALSQAEAIAEAAGGEAGVNLADLLRPALEGATAELGAGVLSDGGPSAEAILADESVEVFEITASGKHAGYFAITISQSASQAPAAAPAESAGKVNLSRIADLEMSLAVEIGRTRMSVREALAMEPGSVIELDRSAGTPADVLVNGKAIARGEVVVVDQDYAVRILHVLDASDNED